MNHEALDALLEKAVMSDHAPSTTVHVDRQGQTVYARSVGYADLEQQVPAAAETVYEIGSITKCYTAIAVLTLVDAGKLDLDAPLSQYLPDYVGPARAVTVRQLLQHTAGIPTYTAMPKMAGKLEWVPLTREEMVASFADEPLEFEPGTEFNYSNSGYYLLGLVVEAVTGQDFYAFLAEAVLEPLGLSQTFSGKREELVPHRSHGYSVSPAGYVNAAPTPYLTPFAAGSLLATAADVTRFRRAVHHGDHYSEWLRKSAVSGGRFPDGTPNQYCLGALIETDFHGHRSWGHTGGISGYNSYHMHLPDEDLTIVVLQNWIPMQPGIGSYALVQDIAAEILGVSEAEHEIQALPSGDLREFAGAYRLTPVRMGTSRIRVLENEDGLQVSMGPEGAPGVPMLPIGPDEFLVREISGIMRFRRSEGAVAGFRLEQGGLFFPAVRDGD
jgi:CubicO group peptidase (beta-lactamase class C family)